jgi:hypothetical protein
VNPFWYHALFVLDHTLGRHVSYLVLDLVHERFFLGRLLPYPHCLEGSESGHDIPSSDPEVGLVRFDLFVVPGSKAFDDGNDIAALVSTILIAITVLCLRSQ